MYAFPDWRAAPADDVPDALADWLGETGSLTERLVGLGRGFAVVVLAQHTAQAWPDECQALGLPVHATVQLREVALTLDGVPYVFARSLCRQDSPVWTPVLARGSRSLGLTLFADSGMLRHPLQFIAGQPAQLALLAQAQHACWPDLSGPLAARRSLFGAVNDALLVHEVFHPDLVTVSPP